MSILVIHKTLEEHIYDMCSNHECMKRRSDEDLKSFFEGSTHYIKWNCSNCGIESWFRSKKFSSGLHHMRL